MLVARHYVIGGRVQGVGFRYFSRAAASREGIGGWVRNRPDGCVEVLAEGDVESIDRFERHLRSGPPRARVERFEWNHRAPTGQETGFIIT
jgi:acylphosphatase